MKKSTKNLVPSIIVFSLATFFSLNQSVYGQNRPQGGGQHEPPTFVKLLAEMDANEDGKLSKSEVKGPLKKEFATIDTNEDGFITDEEFEKAPKKQQKGQRPPRN